MIKYLSKVLYAISGSRRNLILLLIAFVLTSVLEAVGIGLVGPFLNLASRPQLVNQNEFLNSFYTKFGFQSSSQFVALLGLVIAIIFVFKSFFYFLAKAYIIKFSFDQKGKLCVRLLKAYLDVPYTFHLGRNTATLINNIILETGKFCNGCLIQLLNAISNAVITLVLLILLLQTSVLFLGIVLAAFLPLLVFFQYVGKLSKTWGKQTSQSQKEIIRIINHALGGVKETRVIGCEPYFEKQMEQQVHILEKSVTLFQASQILPRITLEAVLVLAIVAFVCVSVIGSSQGDLTGDLTSVLGVFAVASIRLIPSVSQLVQAIGNMQNNAYALDILYLDLKQIEDLERTKQTHAAKHSKHHLPISQGSNQNSGSKVMAFDHQISLSQVTYSYPESSRAAIEDVSLTIKKGQSIALIGKSGAGKTTLVDILLGLFQPQGGDIQVDGLSIYSNIRAWQNLIGYIPQSIFLIDDTIERNIAFGVPDHLIDSDRLHQAIEAAQLQNLIEQLPDGIKTHVGERGVRLSGGQRQRIGIARALYHEREILVLDEATSALDHETETLVNDAIRELSGQKTMIIIAHRLSTVEHCDYVYLMENGRLARSGSYQEVVLGK